VGWVSASPYAATGYGTQTREIVKRLRERHNVVCIGVVGDVIVWGGRQRFETPYGDVPIVALSDGMSAPELIDEIYTPEFKLDIIVTLMDAFGVEYLNEVKIPVIGYIPIDGPFTDSWKYHLRNYYKIIAYSEFGYNELLKFFPPSKVGYIPHGVDTETYRPLEDRDEIRVRLEREHGIPRDSVLYVSTAANVGPRKELPLLMHTFKRFVERGYDAHLYLHTNAFMPYPRGYDLLKWREMLGIKRHIHFPKYNPIVSPASDAELAELYNAADVYVSNSVAEGFGLPIAEAMSCGTPAICPDNSAQVELVRGHGWITRNVPTDMYFQVPVYVPQLTYYPVPDQNSLLENLIESYEHPELRRRYGEAGRRFVVERHSWDVVMKKWFLLLSQIEDELNLLKFMAET
jgi:glycosyltransferase involved in cell wall biosynthesis